MHTFLTHDFGHRATRDLQKQTLFPGLNRNSLAPLSYIAKPCQTCAGPLSGLGRRGFAHSLNDDVARMPFIN